MTTLLRATASLALFAGISGLAVPAHADDASKRTKVEQLLTIMKLNALPDQILGDVKNQTQTLSQRQFGPNPTPDQQKQVADFQTKITTLVSDSVGWKVMQPDFVKLYSDTYTEPEIDGILSFYKSPVGQSMLAKAPELSQKSQEIARQRMATIQPQLRQAVQDFVKQAQASAPAASPSSTTPAPARTAPSLNSTPAPASTPKK